MNGVESKIDGLKNEMEAKIDGIEGNMEYLKKYMEGLKEGLEKLLQEKLPNGEKVVEETHDEKKINVNRDLINLNFGWKTYHIPKMDIRKFDGKDLVTWILHMDKYFDLNNMKNTQKVGIKTLHL